ncbi:hypothetical protein NZD88_16010 [Chryseobacterium antibioticum]|uniref:Lipoprotein n=1 Tax=Chryseobacterium pyrolae TaxID=2987481 RepID=A0ABT2IKA3_9FLAO|nr:hypothetical protein [Chryseobacterium pyrolae]MCT2409053.1 hypothetical protein [Chryseobacterium pyrolae]
MKGLIISLGMFVVFSCKAQQTYPLNTDFEGIPQGSYLKDLNNELTPYTGEYKANFKGNEIILYITKEENRLIDRVDKKFYRDVLSIKYIIKNSSGNILQNTQNMSFQPSQVRHTIYSMRTRPNLGNITFSYGGTNCSVGNGKIILKKINSTQISWEYRPNDIILDDSKCPPGTDINIYLPETKDLIFTKQ